MPLTPYPGFIGPAYTAESPIADAQALINWYPEIIESGSGKNQAALYPTPGYTNFAQTALSPGRGIYYQDNRGFAVIGFGFFEFEANGTLTQRGTVDSDGLPATMCSNGDGGHELFVTSGGSGYVYDLLANTLTIIAGLSAVMGDYLDGFFLALGVDNTLRISNYLDGATWDVTQFRTRAAASDRWISMRVIHRQVWLFGSQTYEIWENAGTSPWPFQLIQGMVFSVGNLAPFSMAKVGESIAWLGQNEQGGGTVHMASQYAPQRISNHAVEWAIAQYLQQGLDLSTAVAYTYQEVGHYFYKLTFPPFATWVFDLITGQWHQEAFWNTRASAQPPQFEASRGMFHTFAFGQHIVLDRALGKLYRAGLDLFTDADDQPIRRVRRAPHLASMNQQMFYGQFRLDMQVGVGNSVAPGVDPQMSLRVSNDGGLTWGNEQHRSVGKIGEYLTQVWWNCLGRARDRVFEVSGSDPVPYRLINAYLRLKAGTS